MRKPLRNAPHTCRPPALEDFSFTKESVEPHAGLELPTLRSGPELRRSHQAPRSRCFKWTVARQNPNHTEM